MSDVAVGWICPECQTEFAMSDLGRDALQEHHDETGHTVFPVAVEAVESHDPVNSPSHYTSGKIEVIDFIEDQGLGFHEGNVVKYVARAGKKDPDKHIQDLEKARWYLDRRIKNLKEAAE